MAIPRRPAPAALPMSFEPTCIECNGQPQEPVCPRCLGMSRPEREADIEETRWALSDLFITRRTS